MNNNNQKLNLVEEKAREFRDVECLKNVILELGLI